ncbi:MAG TPA: hypothetical protein DCE41_26855 [Cytophagales bacterium]|nr:hypothetical protein [Cytophagales bacterium]HAA22591.1 hypothetical protein [Cytophagales bacterium]HAP63538.1 hypothetical protein [Cytophagales bacterium]
MRLLIPIICFITIITCHGQPRSNAGQIAVIGSGAIVDFNQSPPQYIGSSPDSYFSCSEMSGAASDSLGMLFFYTDGDQVWDSEHRLMEGSLSGSALGSLSQLLVVPAPKQQWLYHLIHMGFQGGPLFNATIDMRLNNGKGKIISTDTLWPSVSEKLTIIPHPDSLSLWLIGHEFDSDAFLSFRIKNTGIDPVPIISNLGLVPPAGTEEINGTTFRNTNALGYLVSSPDGKTLACAHDGVMSTLELLDFDANTGIISNARLISETPNTGSYGLEFSPDGSKLYQSRVDSRELWQFDLSNSTLDSIRNSATLIADDIWGALQLAPDGKIYAIGGALSHYIHVIHSPNALNSDCNFERDYVFLEEDFTLLGLPELTYSILYPDFIYDYTCAPGTSTFRLVDSDQVVSVVWDFDDPLSGPLNSDTRFVSEHYYQSPGIYSVTATVELENGDQHTLSQIIEIPAPPIFDLVSDTLLCNNRQLTIALPNPREIEYQWENGSRSNTRVFQEAGTYSVTGFNDLCSQTLEITISTLNSPRLTLADEIICYDESIQISLPEENTTYTWDNEMVSSERNLSTPDTYTVIAENACGSVSDSFTLSHYPRLEVDLGEDRLLCVNEQITIVLDSTDNWVRYVWEDGSMTNTRTLDRPGVYWVEKSNSCESVSDEILIESFLTIDYTIPTAFSPNNDGINDTFSLHPKMLGSELRVFNRWGKAVFQSNEYDNNWTGDSLPEGVYYYLLLDPCSGQTIKGTVQLVK